jgi:hypothetical protein
MRHSDTRAARDGETQQCGIERERLPNALFVFGKALMTGLGLLRPKDACENTFELWGRMALPQPG